MNLCVVIGRGGDEAATTTEENRLLSERPLKDSKTRLAVFRNIAHTFGKGGDQWPLWLPPALRALVAFEITCPKKTTGGSDPDASPERLVVNGFIDSMCNVLQDLETYTGQGFLAADDRAIVDYDIPLSLHDARMFLAAAGRLNAAEQSKNLSRLVTAVRKQVKVIAEDEEALEEPPVVPEMADDDDDGSASCRSAALLLSLSLPLSLTLVPTSAATDAGEDPPRTKFNDGVDDAHVVRESTDKYDKPSSLLLFGLDIL